MKVWIYIDRRRQMGGVDHLFVFADEVAADEWFRVHQDHPEGAAAKPYPVRKGLRRPNELRWPRRVWVYYETSKEEHDPSYLLVFEDDLAADRWFKKNDPEGVAWAYRVLERHPEPFQAIGDCYC